MSNCKTKKCGCLDVGLTTPSPCPHDQYECPNPEPCAETFSDCCIIHDGDGIADLNIQTGDRVCDIWQKIALAITAIQGGGGGGPVAPENIPNDDWVILQDNAAGISSPTWQGSATSNATPLISVAYKVLNVDSAIVKVRAFLDATITAPDNSINFRFTLDPIAIAGSNWFPTLSKYFTTTMGPFLTPTPFAVPIQITPVWDGITPGIASPTLDQYQSKGRAFINNGLVFVQAAGPVLPNNRYQFSVEFELTAQLLPV